MIFKRMPRQRRQGIVYNIQENGIARLIFDEERSKFHGMLETISGETMLVSGKVVNELSTAGTSDDVCTFMSIDIVDGEEGSVFHIESVKVCVDSQSALIESPSVRFISNNRMIGMKASVEIQQHMSPEMAEMSSEVFVGDMQIHLLASHRPSPSIRRESICDQNNDIKILEVSDDFLA